MANGADATLHTLCNSSGAKLEITDYGATVTGLQVADRRGEFADVVLGYDSVAGYEQCHAYLGCIVGRVANRIGNARFTLDGRQYQLEANQGEHHLHGASAGIHRRRWSARFDDGALVLSTASDNGDGGYPGRVSIEVSYRWSDENELCIDYLATTDQPTLVNLSNHAYFNLAGHTNARRGAVYNHELQLHADAYLPTNAQNIPLNRMDPVASTPMDFRAPRAIGERIEAAFDQLQIAAGYDHCWVLRAAQVDRPVFAAEVFEPVSGRRMRVSTTQPGLQFYSANHLNELAGKLGQRYGSHGALCLEAQGFPDAINQPSFPSVVLRPGQQYRHSTVYSFDCV